MSESNKKRVKDVVSKDREAVEVMTYYTFRGKHDSLDAEGYPLHSKEKPTTYAKCAGERRYLKVDDDHGRFINPAGLYPQRVSRNRWLPVSKKVFTDYLNFLKTKKGLYLTSAEREAV